eukprot:scaffold187845_cov22-Tisochrysis_lutea.AAC.1
MDITGLRNHRHHLPTRSLGVRMDVRTPSAPLQVHGVFRMHAAHISACTKPHLAECTQRTSALKPGPIQQNALSSHLKKLLQPQHSPPCLHTHASRPQVFACAHQLPPPPANTRTQTHTHACKRTS